jgi:hypothetical protein
MTPISLAHRAHPASNFNRAAIETGALCGCFYCEKVFSPDDQPIKMWTDYRRTAMCPYCGIDSVISSADIPEITNEAFLRIMNKKWFGEPRRTK